MILTCEQEQGALNELHKAKRLRKLGLNHQAKRHLNASLEHLHRALKYYQLERGA
jgi:hypothetical protein